MTESETKSLLGIGPKSNGRRWLCVSPKIGRKYFTEASCFTATEMKIPSDLRFHSDIRLMVFRPYGILDEKRINTVVEFVEQEEARMDRPFDRFTDLTQLDAIDLDFESLFRIALHRRLVYSRHPPAKSAFFVANKAAARIVKVPVLLTSHSPLHVRMFWDLAEAAKWLDVPKETLEDRREEST